MGEGRGPVEILITNYSCVPCGRCVHACSLAFSAFESV
jgi:Fe-S-cluster-containing hydrogenase component 2